MSDVAIVIPVLDEQAALPRLVQAVAKLQPRPAQIVAVDGGSGDASVSLIREAGWDLIECSPGRAIQINAGVEAASAPIVCVLHADTLPPADMVAVIERTMADSRIAMAGFTPLIRGPEKTRWGTTFHNWIKTWYAPLLLRPHLFVQGGRLLFGDHAMFFRRADFLEVGGCDPGTPVMEEADLCIKMTRFGKIRLLPRTVVTSDRRIAAWGALKTNWIYFKVGMMWAFGARKRLEKHYPHVR
jgi:glycosyltransferase involved in cell wall biosynthesis